MLLVASCGTFFVKKIIGLLYITVNVHVVVSLTVMYKLDIRSGGISHVSLKVKYQETLCLFCQIGNYRYYLRLTKAGLITNVV